MFTLPLAPVEITTIPVAPELACVNVSPATACTGPVNCNTTEAENILPGITISSAKDTASGISFGSDPSATNPNSP